jgi:hypothetical protein
MLPGCKTGQDPYPVIPPDSDPKDFLPPPPAGVTPGTTHQLGMLYRFNRFDYQLYRPVPGTPSQFIKRDSVLAPRGRSAGDPALKDPVGLDLTGTLAQVYADPRLFGFVSGDASQVGWVAGETIPGATAFFPMQTGDWRDYNHNSNEWTRVDSILGLVSDVPTAGGRDVYLTRTASAARADREQFFKPTYFESGELHSATAGQGFFLHGMSLVAERAVNVLDRPCVSCEPLWQRNPRPYWVSSGSFFTGLDVCLDGLPGVVEVAPVQLAGDPVRIGDLYTTWTYVTVPTDLLRERLALLEELGSGCAAEFVTGRDTLRAFPTRTFSILARYDVRADRAYDYLELRSSLGDLIGSYGARDGQIDVIKFTVSMFSAGLGGETPSLYAEVYYARGIGEVVRSTGSNPDTRSLTRLRQAQVGPRRYVPGDFSYKD